MAPGWSRVIGEPRESKGYARILSCQAEGVAEFILQKRDAPELFKAAGKGKLASVYRWTTKGEKILTGEPLASDAAMP
jgi:ribosomal protein RSM22 (predicted rRNA methylase)